MSDKYCDIESIKQMAKKYLVADNPLFVATLHNYETVQLSIEKIHECLADSGSATVTKEYVKGRQNIYTNPLIKELPKLVAIANKTANELMDIISRYGSKSISQNPKERWDMIQALQKAKFRVEKGENAVAVIKNILGIDGEETEEE